MLKNLIELFGMNIVFFMDYNILRYECLRAEFSMGYLSEELWPSLLCRHPHMNCCTMKYFCLIHYSTTSATSKKYYPYPHLPTWKDGKDRKKEEVIRLK